MPQLSQVTDTEALAQSLDALIAFADQEKNFVLAANLDAARVQFSELYGQPKDRFDFRLICREYSTSKLGSRLIDQSQKMTVAASAIAEKKTVGHRS